MSLINVYHNILNTPISQKARYLLKTILKDKKLRFILIGSFLLIKAITAIIIIFVIPGIKENI